MIENPAKHGAIEAEWFVGGPSAQRPGFDEAQAPEPVCRRKPNPYGKRVAQQRADQTEGRVPTTVIVVKVAERALITDVELRRETDQEGLAFKLGESEPLEQDCKRGGLALRSERGFDVRP